MSDIVQRLRRGYSAVVGTGGEGALLLAVRQAADTIERLERELAQCREAFGKIATIPSDTKRVQFIAMNALNAIEAALRDG
jgi:hypothetical protein